MDHLTVGELRAKMDGLPDDALVLGVSSHDDAYRFGKAHIDIVREKRPGSGEFETFFTPEEFAEFCDEDGNLPPDSPYGEHQRPPADGVRALTLWR